jgi:hypothetical protein
MSHRSGKTLRRAFSRDPRLLVLGVALVLAALVMSTCEPSGDLLGGSPLTGAGSPDPPGGEPV